jgi:homoserine dehydrogenase
MSRSTTATPAIPATGAPAGTGSHSIDAYRVTGTSPTPVLALSTQRAASASPVSSPRPRPLSQPAPLSQPTPATRRRTYDTVHLLGPGAVGRALLNRLVDDRRRVVAVTDSTATLHDPAGVDVRAVVAWKNAGGALRDHSRALHISASAAIEHVDADVVADASATDLDRQGWTDALGQALARGACVVSAAKAALCEAGAEWLTGEHSARVGCNAVLGGTGRSFLSELPDLRQRTRSIAIVGNASTTAIIQVIESGGTTAEGIAEAQRLGFLEPDPELDLRGDDAAVKLAIVAGIITGRRIDPRTITCEDFRTLNVVTLRARARRNATTRLIGRLDDTGGLTVRYDEVPRDSILAVPCGRVVYEYRLTRDERRLHIGTGLGADATAGALWADLRALAAEAACRTDTEAAR